MTTGLRPVRRDVSSTLGNSFYDFQNHTLRSHGIDATAHSLISRMGGARAVIHPIRVRRIALWAVPRLLAKRECRSRRVVIFSLIRIFVPHRVDTLRIYRPFLDLMATTSTESISRSAYSIDKILEFCTKSNEISPTGNKPSSKKSRHPDATRKGSPPIKVKGDKSPTNGSSNSAAESFLQASTPWLLQQKVFNQSELCPCFYYEVLNVPSLFPRFPTDALYLAHNIIFV